MLNKYECNMHYRQRNILFPDLQILCSRFSSMIKRLPKIQNENVCVPFIFIEWHLRRKQEKKVFKFSSNGRFFALFFNKSVLSFFNKWETKTLKTISVEIFFFFYLKTIGIKIIHPFMHFCFENEQCNER